MLKAMNDAGDPVMAQNAVHEIRYFCPECEEPVIFKAGRTVIPHFAHKPGHWCEFGTGESLRHHEMKARIGELLDAFIPEYELALIAGRRADVVLVKQRLVVECQASKIGIPEWEQRTRDYNQAGYGVLWVWDFNRLGKEEDHEWRVPDEIRFCHRESFGRVMVLQAKRLFAAHLYTIWRPNDWPEGSGGYYPRTKRSISRRDLLSPLRPQRMRSASGLWLVGFGEGVWWKPRGRCEAMRW